MHSTDDSAAPLRRQPWLWLLLVGLLGLALFRLDRGNLANNDDGFYATAVRSAQRDGRWLTYNWHGARLDHRYPPLHFLMLRVSTTLLGESSYSLRLPAALMLVCCAMIMALLIYELRRSPAAATCAALLCASSGILYLTARSCRTDLTVATFSALAIYAYLRSWRAGRWLWLAAIGAGLAVLAKGVIGGLVLLPIAIDALLARRHNERVTAGPTRAQLWGSAALLIVVAGWWHLYQIARDGWRFIDTYLLYNIFGRMQGISGVQTSEPFLLAIWRREGLLLAVWLIALLFVALRLRGRGPRLISIWALCGLLPLLISSTRLEHYLAPAIPPLSALCALAIAPLLARRRAFAALAVAGCLALFFRNNIDAFFAPDFSPHLAEAARDARQLGNELIVFNEYHATAEYYADMPTRLITDQAGAYRLLTGARAMRETAQVALLSPTKIPLFIGTQRRAVWLTTRLFERRLLRYFSLAERPLQLKRYGAYSLVSAAQR